MGLCWEQLKVGAESGTVRTGEKPSIPVGITILLGPS